jgi:orotidine-5'-phosphate decarboxylase
MAEPPGIDGDDDLGEVPDELRRRLAIALDVDDLVAAERMARKVAPWFGIAKVGLELYSAAGPDAVASMSRLGFEVFCDVKLHDIPTTVRRAACVLGAIGAKYVTIHTAGGVDMVAAGVEGLAAGAESGGWPAPVPLGVTVLTSDHDSPADLMAERLDVAVRAGCRGVVCSASDLGVVGRLAPDLLTVVPGIRLAGGSAHDQARVATPGDALAAGADVLVVGRAVTAEPDPAAAAAALAAAVLS